MTATMTDRDLVLSACSEHYGVHVTAIGEDADHLILGHHPERRCIAALRAYGREMSYDLTWGGDGWMGNSYEDAVVILHATWLRLVPTESTDEEWCGVYCGPDAQGAFPVMAWTDSL